MQQNRRRIYFIGILLLAAAWIFVSADRNGNTTAGLIPAPQAGFLAPDFTLETLDGESITLSELRGQVVLVNFWATWCPPCKAEMPAFEQAYQDYADEGFVLLAVNAIQQDSVPAIETFNAEYGLSFPILLDTNGDTNRAYQVRSLPTSFFVDKDGIISEVIIGGPMAEALIRARIEELINQN